MSAPRIQRGYTLISMLVGLLIGVMTVGAMLMLYKSLVVVARDVQQQARKDGDVVTSALGAQVELQQAGFGVDAAAATDLVLLADATLTEETGEQTFKLAGTAAAGYASAVRGNAVIWGYNPTGSGASPDPSAYRCTGLVLDGSGAQRKLFQLLPQACGNAASWAQLHWQRRALAAAGSLQATGQFELVPQSCWPYGHSDAASAIQLNYYPDPASAASAAGRANDPTMAAYAAFSVCLANIRH